MNYYYYYYYYYYYCAGHFMFFDAIIYLLTLRRLVIALRLLATLLCKAARGKLKDNFEPFIFRHLCLCLAVREGQIYLIS